MKRSESHSFVRWVVCKITAQDGNLAGSANGLASQDRRMLIWSDEAVSRGSRARFAYAIVWATLEFGGVKTAILERR